MKKRYKSARQIDSVIDLEKIRSGPRNCMERDPEAFFSLTYPSSDIRAMLRALSRRYGPSGSDTNEAGLFLAESVKGLGKSHGLLTAYHLFAHPEQASQWMESLGFSWSPPKDPIIIVEKFTDQTLPFDSLWTALGRQLRVDWQSSRPPSLDEFRTTLSDRPLILIFDELERGISNIGDPARKSQNLSFLQMVSEEANRNPRVSLFAAIYDGTTEPGATLKRVPRRELRFRSPQDRAGIVRHRLFADADIYDKAAADALIGSYVNTWKRLGVDTSDEYLSRLKSAYPFLPELIELIFERIAESGGFQGTRGALGLLAAMLDAAPSGSFLFTAAHCMIGDHACADRLQDLDPSAVLINCAASNLRDLAGQPYAESLASAVLLTSLAPAGRMRGVSREELVRHVLAPGCDPNQFESSFQSFRTYGSFFHEREGRFFFDLEENEYAKVALATIHIQDERARDEVQKIWKQDLFGDAKQTVFFSDPDTTRQALDGLSKNAPRYVLSPRHLSDVERHALYFGAEQRNQILLFEPKDDNASHFTNADLLSFAKKSIAASDLAPSAASAERAKRYEIIAGKERRYVRDTIKAAGLMYVRIERWSNRPGDSVFELESLGKALNKEDVLRHLRTHIYPQPLIQEHVLAHIDSFTGKTISQVEDIYRSTLGYPVPLSCTAISDAIVGLVEDRSRVLGLHHTRRNFCGEHVMLGAGELPLAILAEPWPEASPPPSVPKSPEALPTVPTAVEPEPEGIPPIPPGPSVTVEERSTIACRTREELRKQIATRIQDMEGAEIHKAVFNIFANHEDVDLAGYPSTLRGALTGLGSVEVQLKITCPGPMDKAEVETRCESLPKFDNANYQARLSIETKASSEIGESSNMEDEQ
ncbi:MAG: hypothetical protein HWN68_13125 [Desulfobacterales bacterium]|nr:hypothetical protein [Desulfobacterales bacterium]